MLAWPHLHAEGLQARRSLSQGAAATGCKEVLGAAAGTPPSSSVAAWPHPPALIFCGAEPGGGTGVVSVCVAVVVCGRAAASPALLWISFPARCLVAELGPRLPGKAGSVR